MFNCFSRQKEALLDRCHVAVSSCCYVAMSQADGHIANPRIRGLHGAFHLFIEFDDLQPPDLQAGEKWGSTFSWEDLDARRKASCRSAINRYPADPTRLLQDAACISIQTEGSVIGCCKFPLSRLMKSNVFDCSWRNFNACAWKLDTAIVQLGSIMCNQERTKGPPKDYVAVVIPCHSWAFVFPIFSHLFPSFPFCFSLS